MTRWYCDPEFDLDLPQGLIAEHFPELGRAAVKRLGEGWDHQVFEVGGEWVFRFPKRREVQRALARERAILPRLAQQLSAPIPRYEYIGQPSARFPAEFVGYRKLPGTPLQALQRPLSRPSRARLARELGQFLTLLHGVNPNALAGALPNASPASLSEPLGGAEEHLAALHALDTRLCRRVERWLRRARAAVTSLGPMVVSHGDFDVEHILVDHRDGSLTGVIDWGNAELAPAVSDFVGLYGLGGAPFLDQVLSHYEGPFAPAHFTWLLERNVYVGLRNIGFGRAAGQPAFVAAGVRALRRALPRAPIGT